MGESDRAELAKKSGRDNGGGLFHPSPTWEQADVELAVRTPIRLVDQRHRHLNYKRIT